VQYTFTHKQYTEQHSETEYTERNIHKNKDTSIIIHKINKSIITRGSQKIRFPILLLQITSHSEMALYSLITHFTSLFFQIIIIIIITLQ
jgi:hypothetical protein